MTWHFNNTWPLAQGSWIHSEWTMHVYNIYTSINQKHFDGLVLYEYQFQVLLDLSMLKMNLHFIAFSTNSSLEMSPSPSSSTASITSNTQAARRSWSSSMPASLKVIVQRLVTFSGAGTCHTWRGPPRCWWSRQRPQSRLRPRHKRQTSSQAWPQGCPDSWHCLPTKLKSFNVNVISTHGHNFS